MTTDVRVLSVTANPSEPPSLHDALDGDGIALVAATDPKTAVGRLGDGVDAVVVDAGVSDHGFVRAIDRCGEPVILFGEVEAAAEPLRAAATDLVGTAAALSNRVLRAARRCRAERSLDSHRTLVETVGGPMYVLDGDGRVEFANEPMAAFLNVERESLLGRRAGEFLTEESCERATELLADLRGDPDREWGLQEIVVVTDTGERRYAECSLAAAGEGYGSVGSVRPIAERRDRRQALKTLHGVATTIHAEESVDSVYERVVDAAVEALDFTLCTVLVNEGEWLVPYATSDGAPEGGSRRMRTDQGLAGATYQRGESIVVDNINSDDTSDPADDGYRSGISVPIADHGVFQAVSTRVNAFDEDDVEFAELLASHAASAIDNLEQAAAVRRQNERLDRFVGVVSHDLRNPLNVAEGRIRLARAERDGEHLAAATDALNRMEELLDDLLTLAKQGERVGDLEPVDLPKAVRQSWATVESGAPDATLTVETDRRIRADPGRLRQLVTNLLGNAVEHGAGETVAVTVGDLDDGFYVADDGPGIPEGDRRTIFDSGYTTSDAGTGFGLAIVDEIADAHGWSIRATESPEGGARFEITGVDDGD